jgi:hypothetical protein
MAGSVHLADLRVWRDIYYAAADAWGAERTYQVGWNELFVVGDNAAVSFDSRHPAFRVLRSDVIARVVAGDRSQALPMATTDSPFD